MSLTWEEQDEIQYERWLMADGPAKATAEHKERATVALGQLKDAGYAVLSEELVREPFHDVSVIEAVVRKGDQIDLIRWHTFNKGWMRKCACGGWTIFRPLDPPKRLSPELAAVVF